MENTISEAELYALIDAQPDQVGTDRHLELQTVWMSVPETEELAALDPFGDAYRDKAMAIRSRISRRTTYAAERDEEVHYGKAPDIWRGIVPYAFRQTKLIAEFLTSWGAIFQALDARSGQSVLEYGCGTGQILLLLARSGVEAYGVDLDTTALDFIRRQNDAMGLDVKVERAEFGKGFDDKTFDRILFFEAFHHAADFAGLLDTLHDRLAPGGKLVFCGEPIVDDDNASVPFAWGPRLDGLSVFCMRRFGWMELGFRQDFFVELLMRHGWQVSYQPNPVYRATAYIAEPWVDRLDLGAGILLPGPWDAPEGTHRWTVGERACVPLPAGRFPRFSLDVDLVNHCGESKAVQLSAGGQTHEVTLEPGEKTVVSLADLDHASELAIETTLSSVPGDPRMLGVAVVSVVVTPTGNR